jgi:hypothetical protein
MGIIEHVIRGDIHIRLGIHHVLIRIVKVGQVARAQPNRAGAVGHYPQFSFLRCLVRREDAVDLGLRRQFGIAGPCGTDAASGFVPVVAFGGEKGKPFAREGGPLGLISGEGEGVVPVMLCGWLGFVGLGSVDRLLTRANWSNWSLPKWVSQSMAEVRVVYDLAVEICRLKILVGCCYTLVSRTRLLGRN